MRTVGYGGMQTFGRLPDELAATATPHRYYTATKPLEVSLAAMAALDAALWKAFRHTTLWDVLGEGSKDAPAQKKTSYATQVSAVLSEPTEPRPGSSTQGDKQ